MAPIRACALPGHALLSRYGVDGGYVDCYSTEIDRPVTQAEFVEAFYTTAVFKLERWLLARFVARPSTDVQARELAKGERTAFAAWNVEAAQAGQLLLCDFNGRTRSWLMREDAQDGQATRLYFGSAVVPSRDHRSGTRRMGFTYCALLGFHKLYSRILLRAAAKRLMRRDAR